MSSIKLRSHQKPIVQKCLNILDKDHRCLIWQPGGTGKTEEALAAITDLMVRTTDFSAVWIVGTRQLVKQTRARVNEYGLGKVVEVTTWQEYSNRTDAIPVDCLVVDEAHFGASGDGISIRKCMEIAYPANLLLLTATPQNIEWGLFDQKDVNGVTVNGKIGPEQTAFLSVIEAYEQNLLNPVKLVEIFSGLKVSIRQRLIEKAFGAKIEDFEESSPQELASRLAARGITNIKAAAVQKSLNKLIDRRIQAGVKVFVAKEVDANGVPQKAIFRVPAIQYIESTVKLLRKSLKRSKDSVVGIHSKLSDGEQDRLTGLFCNVKNPESPKIAVVCGMLGLGTDIESLEVFVNCAFNPENLVHNNQNLFRLTRMMEGKAAARFYFVVDCAHYTANRSKIRFNEDFVKTAFRGVKPEDLVYVEEIANMAAASAVEDQQSFYGKRSVQFRVGDPRVSEVDGVKTAETEFVIVAATQHKAQAPVDYARVAGETGYRDWSQYSDEQIIEMGRKFDSISDCRGNDSGLFNEIYKRRLIRIVWPDTGVRGSSQENSKKIIDWANEHGHLPNKRSKDPVELHFGRAHMSLKNPNSNAYNPEHVKLTANYLTYQEYERILNFMLLQFECEFLGRLPVAYQLKHTRPKEEWLGIRACSTQYVIALRGDDVDTIEFIEYLRKNYSSFDELKIEARWNEVETWVRQNKAVPSQVEKRGYYNRWYAASSKSLQRKTYAQKYGPRKAALIKELGLKEDD